MEVKRVLAFDVHERLPATSSTARVEKKRKALKKKESQNKVEEKELTETEPSSDDLPDVYWPAICRSTVPKRNSLLPSVKFIVVGGTPVADGKGLISYKQQRMTITCNGQTFVILFDAFRTLETKVIPSLPQFLSSHAPVAPRLLCRTRWLHSTFLCRRGSSKRRRASPTMLVTANSRE
jgi:hypothetical protein